MTFNMTLQNENLLEMIKESKPDIDPNELEKLPEKDQD